MAGEDAKSRRASGARLAAGGWLLVVLAVTMGMPFLLLMGSVLVLAGLARVPRGR